MEPYLLHPGHAISERAKWEHDIEAQIRTELRSNALVAASFPGWGRTVRRLFEALTTIPRAAFGFVMSADTREEETTDEMAKRLAPTLATAAYNNHVLSRLAEEGIPYKQWLTRHDPKVRPAHVLAEGQIQPLSRPFVVGGEFMQFPADSATASIGLWINDRCVVMGSRTP